jgi:hypothetical protein
MELKHVIDEIGANSMPKPNTPTYKYGSSTYNILAYAYAYDKAMTIEDFQKVSKVNNKGFDDKNTIKRSLAVLEENKAMIRLNDTYWRITAIGMRQALELAREHNPRMLNLARQNNPRKR